MSVAMLSPESLLVRATLCLLFAFVLTGVLRHGSASVHHRIWLLTLAGVLVLPLLIAGLPKWELLPALERASETGTSAIAGAEIGSERAHSPLPAVERSAPGVVTPMGTADRAFEAGEREGRRVSDAGTGSIGSGIVWTWAVGTGVVLLWMIAGLGRLAMLRRRGEQIADPEIQREVHALAERAGVRARSIRLLTSDEVGVPVTWGFFRPVIVLPRHLVHGLDAERRTALLHELIHIRRKDWAAHLMAFAACALYWFHPLAWLARARLLVVEEMAVDEEVVALGVSRSSYIAHLATLARSLSVSRREAGVVVPLARPGSLPGRLRRLVRIGHAKAPSRRAVSWSVGGVTAQALLVSTVGAQAGDGPGAVGPFTLLPLTSVEETDLPEGRPFGRIIDAALLSDGKVAILEGRSRGVVVVDDGGRTVESIAATAGAVDRILPHGEGGFALGDGRSGLLHLYAPGPEGLAWKGEVELGGGFHDACWMDGLFYHVDGVRRSASEEFGATRSRIQVTNEDGERVGSLAPLPEGVHGLEEGPYRNAKVACLHETSTVVLQSIFSGEMSGWAPDGSLRWRVDLPGFRSLSVTGDSSQVTYQLREGEEGFDRLLRLFPGGSGRVVAQIGVHGSDHDLLGRAAFVIDPGNGGRVERIEERLPELTALSSARAVEISHVDVSSRAKVNVYEVRWP